MKHLSIVAAFALAASAVPASASKAPVEPYDNRFFCRAEAQPYVMSAHRFYLGGQQRAVVNVEGAGGDIDCVLYEGDFRFTGAQFVARDNGARDGCTFEVTPQGFGPYELLVYNALEQPLERYTVTVQ